MLISYHREMWKQTECKLKNQARAGETVTNPGSHREIVTNPGLQKGNSNKFSGKATVKRRQVLMFCFLGSEGRKNIVYVVLVVAITKENGWPILLRSSFFLGCWQPEDLKSLLHTISRNAGWKYNNYLSKDVAKIAEEKVSRAEWRSPLKTWQLASVENGTVQTQNHRTWGQSWDAMTCKSCWYFYSQVLNGCTQSEMWSANYIICIH